MSLVVWGAAVWGVRLRVERLGGISSGQRDDAYELTPITKTISGVHKIPLGKKQVFSGFMARGGVCRVRGPHNPAR